MRWCQFKGQKAKYRNTGSMTSMYKNIIHIRISKLPKQSFYTAEGSLNFSLNYLMQMGINEIKSIGK